MTTLIKSTTEAEWREVRRQGIGASDAPAILGLSPWKSPIQLYADKLGLADDGTEETEAMRWGRRLEGVIIRAYAEDTDREARAGDPLTVHRSDEWPFMQTTLDGWVMTPSRPGMGVLEIKTTGFFRAEDWADGPPLMYQVQVQHALAVVGARWGSIAVLVGGQRLLWADIERHDGFIARLIEQERAFWDRLQAKEPPTVDDSTATTAVLKALYPAETAGLVVNLPGEAVDWDSAIQEAKVQIKAAETAKRLHENLLRAAIGEAEAGALSNGVVWKWGTREVKGYAVQPRVDRVLARREVK
jgi:putative phage-type endonuclease